GVAFFLENAIRFIWGNDYRSYNVPVTRAIVWHGLRVGREQLAILGVSVVLMLLVQTFLNRTRLGIAMRGSADNPLLARVQGLPTERIVGLATLGGGALAGGAGGFLGLGSKIEALLGTGLLDNGY